MLESRLNQLVAAQAAANSVVSLHQNDRFTTTAQGGSAHKPVDTTANNDVIRFSHESISPGLCFRQRSDAENGPDIQNRLEVLAHARPPLPGAGKGALDVTELAAGYLGVAGHDVLLVGQIVALHCEYPAAVHVLIAQAQT